MSNNRTISNDILLSEVCTRLSQGQSVKLRAKGSSMHPFIRDGADVVLIAPVLSLKTGNVVLARLEDSRYVLHRIVGFKNNEITLMGDANIYGQERCRIEDIYGIAISLYRNGRRHDLTTNTSRLMAALWHSLLPIRRLIQKIPNKK